MLKISYRTILGLDLSIRGTGVCIITNDPSLGGSLIKNTKYKLLYVALVKGATKDGVTKYEEITWSPENGASSGKLLGEASDFSRGVFVADNFLKPLINNYNITHACYEGYAFHGNGRVFDIAEFSAPIKYFLLGQYGEKKLTEVKPTQLKKFFTGNGNATKAGQLYIAEKAYGLKFDDDNLADAFALAMYGAHHIN